MTLGETVHLVVVDENGNIGISSNSMEEVVASLPVHASVSRFGDDDEFWSHCFYRKGYGYVPSVKSVENVDLEVVRGLCRLAYSGNKNHILRLISELFKRLLECPENAEIPTPGTPGNFYLRRIKKIRHG